MNDFIRILVIVPSK